MPLTRALATLAAFAIFLACGSYSSVSTAAEAAENDWPFAVTVITSLDEPWAMSFLPDGRLLISEKKGALRVVTRNGEKSAPVAGVPKVDYGGQGGLGDVVLHPDYASNNVIYLSFVEAGEGDVRGAAVMRARLTLNGSGGELSDGTIVWRQEPKVTGQGHYAHRIAFSPEGKMFITSGDRQKFTPAQDMDQNLGNVIRLNEDGSVPSDNPFADRGGITAQIWSLGHRNPLGISFDREGRLWAHEMGPRHGDELNLILPVENYGWPLISNGTLRRSAHSGS